MDTATACAHLKALPIKGQLEAAGVIEFLPHVSGLRRPSLQATPPGTARLIIDLRVQGKALVQFVSLSTLSPDPAKQL